MISERPYENFADESAKLVFLGRQRQFGLEIYCSTGHVKIYPAGSSSKPVIRMYRNGEFWDSVLEVFTCGVDNSELITLRIGTWNLRGSTSPELQLLVDAIANKSRLDIVMVQETHLRTTDFNTLNYTWKMGPQPADQTRASRGCGFLVSRRLKFNYESFIHSSDLLELNIILGNSEKLILLCTHIPANGLNIYNSLSSLLRRYSDNCERVIIGGDFNAHIGN